MESKQLFDALEDEGAEVEDSLERLMGDEEMYIEYLNKLKDNQNIVALKEAIDANDYKLAEREVHTLKGVGLNLGLLPLVDVCMDLLMDLRAGITDHAEEEYQAIRENFDSWVELIANNQ